MRAGRSPDRRAPPAECEPGAARTASTTNTRPRRRAAPTPRALPPAPPRANCATAGAPRQASASSAGRGGGVAQEAARYNRGDFQRLRLLLNPRLTTLTPYPFERLRALASAVTPNPAKRPINLSIGEPRHPTPSLILEALSAGATTGLAHYPTTQGPLELRESIARWLRARHGLPSLDALTQVLPVLGSREALF